MPRDLARLARRGGHARILAPPLLGVLPAAMHAAAHPLLVADTAPAPAHFFTVDVEEYFHVSAFEAHVPRASWDSLPSRIERSVELLLDLLDRHGATATFFCLGWVAQRHPRMVRGIVERGHEVASHGHLHRRITTLTPDEHRRDLRIAREAIEQAAGAPVLGFRAPSFSIVPGREWALEVLSEEGYRYDSSLFPVARRGYGYPSAPAVPHVWRGAGGTLLELPPATATLFGARIPAAGGGYLRQLPLVLVQRAFRQAAAAGEPGTFYIHPWEVDPEQPRLAVPLRARVRHYRGIASTMSRLERLCAEFRFTSVAARLDELERRLGIAAGATEAPAVPSARRVHGEPRLAELS